MRKALLSLALLISTAVAASAAPEMKTHSSTAPQAKVTVVHYGAPW